MAITAALTVALGLNDANFRSGLNRSRRNANNFVGTVNRNLNTLRRGFFALGAVTATIFGGAALTRFGDELTNINNLLRASGIPANQIGAAFERIQDVAINTRADLETTGRLFARLSRSASDLGLSFEDIEVITRTINQSFVLSGASLQEATNATRQLIQGLQSGTLRGDELRSVLEQAPILIELLNARLGTTTGELRELAAQGGVTSMAVVEALLQGAPRINEQFQSVGFTFSQLGSIIQTQIGPAIGRIVNTALPAIAQVVNIIASAFETLERNAGLVTRAIQVIGILLAGRLIIPAINAITGAFALATRGSAFLRDSARRLQAGLSAVTTTTFTAANGVRVYQATVTTATGVTTVFTGALARLVVGLRILRVTIAFLTGPIGALLTALGFIGFEIYNAITRPTEEATDSLENLDEQIQITNANLNEFTGGATPEVARNFNEINQSVQDLRVRLGEITEAEAERESSLANINQLLEDGLISINQWQQALILIDQDFQNFDRQVEELNDNFNQVGESIQTNIRDTLVEAFRTGELSVRSFLNAVSGSILQVAANALTNQITSSIFSGGGGGNLLSSLGSFLGFQNGGVVPRIPGSSPNRDSVPALLTPGETVVPRGQVPGGVTVNNSFSVSTPEEFRRMAERSASDLADIVQNQLEQRGA